MGRGDGGPPETTTFKPDPSELHNPRVEPILRKYLELRYRLLPYTYTAVRECCDTGLPIIRALWLHYPDDPAALARGDQYPVMDGRYVFKLATMRMAEVAQALLVLQMVSLIEFNTGGNYILIDNENDGDIYRMVSSGGYLYFFTNGSELGFSPSHILIASIQAITDVPAIVVDITNQIGYTPGLLDVGGDFIPF
jgi:hypothetical protein